uniref:Uncharacterized protein n=1 Tax=Macrostomum lignano TaxID=282301 RepID=A0A1I8JPU5_9PLAT
MLQYSKGLGTDCGKPAIVEPNEGVATGGGRLALPDTTAAAGRHLHWSQVQPADSATAEHDFVHATAASGRPLQTGCLDSTGPFAAVTV